MTEYTPQTFTPGVLTVEDMNTVAANQQFLFENLTKVTYRGGVTRSKGVKVLAGKARYVPTEIHFTVVDISFGSYFSSGSAPVVVATVQSERYGRKFVSINPLGGGSQEIDHTGFRALVCGDDAIGGATNAIESGGWVNWIAIGW